MKLVRIPVSLCFLASAGLAVAETSPAAISIPWLGPNLVVNGDFEADPDADGSPYGWTVPKAGASTCAVDTVNCLDGKQSFKLNLPETGNSDLTSAGIPVEDGKQYLFSVSIRQEGFSRPDHAGRHVYQGVAASTSLVWLDNEERSLVGPGTMGFPYGPVPWEIHDLFVTAPAGAHWAKIRIVGANISLKEHGRNIPSALWLDAIQFREYRPPETPEWAKGKTRLIVEGGMADTRVQSFFIASSGWDYLNGSWSKVVVDPNAERGGAVQSREGAGYGIMAHSGPYQVVQPGLYRLVARVRAARIDGRERLGMIDVLSLTSLWTSSPRALLEFWPQRFQKAGEYREFTADFILRDSGNWYIRVHTQDKGSWAIDSIKVFPIYPVADKELLAIYPGAEGSIPPELQPRASSSPPKGLLFGGYGSLELRLQSALRLLGLTVEVKPVWLSRGSNGNRLQGLSDDPKDFFQYNLIVIANVPLNAMTLRHRNIIREFVARGGALVVLGGQVGFERGGWKGSVLDELLPVEIACSVKEGLVQNPNGMELSVTSDCPWREELDSQTKTFAYFLHQVAPKKGARIFATAGGRPFLVAGDWGKGRVLVCTGMPFGNPKPSQSSYWKWSEWSYLLRNSIWWVMRRIE